MEKSKSEVIRYLGGQGLKVPDDLNGLVEECIVHIREVSTPRQVYSTFPITPGAGGIALAGTEILLIGEDIARHLSGCGQAVLLAATLGAEADLLIHRWKRADPIRSLVLDACATQFIEEHCDEIQRRIWAEAEAAGLDLYGSFHNAAAKVGHGTYRIGRKSRLAHSRLRRMRPARYM